MEIVKFERKQMSNTAEAKYGSIGLQKQNSDGAFVPVFDLIDCLSAHPAGRYSSPVIFPCPMGHDGEHLWDLLGIVGAYIAEE